MSWVSKLVLLLSILHVVRGEAQDGVTMLVVAGVVAFVLLIIFVAVLACVLTWNRWFPAIQRSKGKVKMPRSYWKKKQEAKQRLILNTSRASKATASTVMPQEKGAINGGATLVNRAKDTGPMQASWVQGWNNTTPRDDQPYEDLTLTMELDEEPEFRIETSVVDDETLNLGPFKAPEPPQEAPAAEPPEEDYTYTAVNPRPRPHPAEAPTPASAAAAPAITIVQPPAARPKSTDEQTVTMQMDDDDDDVAAPAVNKPSFYNTPLMAKARQMDSSDTPEPPPLPPPPPEDSYSDLLKTSVVAF